MGLVLVRMTYAPGPGGQCRWEWLSLAMARRPAGMAQRRAERAPRPVRSGTVPAGGVAPGVPRVVLRNFPSEDLDLIAVYRDNAEQLATELRALGSSPPASGP